MYQKIYSSDVIDIDVDEKGFRISYFKDDHFVDEEFITFDEIEKKVLEKTGS